MPSASPQPRTVLSFGELLWDLLPTGPVLGGAPGNLAYRLTTLGDRAFLVSRLGRDSLGQSAFDQLMHLGMDPAYVQWDPAWPTGTVDVQVDARGNPDFRIAPDAAYDHIECTPELMRAANEADCVCFGTLAQRSDGNRRALHQLLEGAERALKFLDINLRKDCHSTETITGSLSWADILKLNEPELVYLADLFKLTPGAVSDLAEQLLRRWDLSHCLITLGERGAFVLSGQGETAYAAGYQVKLADTCGSGDACAAGFLHGLLHGESLGRCLQIGNGLGALVATQHGATERISPDTLTAFLRDPPSRLFDHRFDPSAAY